METSGDGLVSGDSAGLGNWGGTFADGMADDCAFWKTHCKELIWD